MPRQEEVSIAGGSCFRLSSLCCSGPAASTVRQRHHHGQRQLGGLSKPRFNGLTSVRARISQSSRRSPLKFPDQPIYIVHEDCIHLTNPRTSATPTTSEADTSSSCLLISRTVSGWDGEGVIIVYEGRILHSDLTVGLQLRVLTPKVRYLKGIAEYYHLKGDP